MGLGGEGDANRGDEVDVDALGCDGGRGSVGLDDCGGDQDGDGDDDEDLHEGNVDLDEMVRDSVHQKCGQ